MNRYPVLVALNQISSVRWLTIKYLIELGWEPQEPVSDKLLDQLLLYGVKSTEIQKIRQELTTSFIAEVDRDLKKRQIQTITFFNEEYPVLLKEIAQPPWVLYIRGDASLLSAKSLAVVGTRRPTPYGLRVARELAAGLVEFDWTIISGMASGIDGEAHRSALEAKGQTIAVLGTGVDVIYPKHHRCLYEKIVREGAVISEMPPGTQPFPWVFPQRNRIISGLSHGTLVIEAAERSGSLITADFSMEQGREVFAVPGPMTSRQSQGTLKLIQDGAKCVRCVADIVEELEGLHFGQIPASMNKLDKINLNNIEEQVYQLIAPDEPIHIDALIEQLNRKGICEEIHQVLIVLELKNMIAQLPGARYIRK
ncbi:DNA-processing protein DprA [Thermoactinomyces mirandus]|uniref:DNA-protecting protein DprA n=1 Tax=Thermoactinomyces mirandus TaxID=2756294 RepID=A0A7W2ARM1_9BACL|nr:DNA-processing protein DprA [Thermoactinomyces mirandus]MBA4602527.1 DNA-protecting protein DprA [Thermoactinomyces mirandus]